MKLWLDHIRRLDPEVDADAVLDLADDCFRIYGEMSRAEWLWCIAMVRRGIK